MRQTVIVVVILAFLGATAVRAQQAPETAADIAPPDSSKNEPPRPPVHFNLTEEAAEINYRWSFQPGRSWSLNPVIRGGLLAPFDFLPVPYSILKVSPFVVAGVDARHSGALESLIMLTLGYTDLRSEKGVSDFQGTAVSPTSVSPATQRFSENMLSASGYADLGVVVGVAPHLKAAFFTAGDSMGFSSLGGDISGSGLLGLVEANAGTLLMYKDDRKEASVFGDLRLEGAMKNMFRNYEYAVVPAGSFGAEYAWTKGGHRVAAGVETIVQRADLGIRPYLDWSHRKISILLAGNIRRRRDVFYPDVAGVGAEVRVAKVRGIQVGLLGNFDRKAYSMAPAPVKDFGLMATLSVNLGKILKNTDAFRMRVQEESRRYSIQDSDAMNARLPGGQYDHVFRTAVLGAQTFAEFVKSIPVRGTDDILAAASAFTSVFGAHNYNYNEPAVLNVDNIEELYQRARASYLNGTKDPILVCIGSSQFAAVLAEALGRLDGVPIEAMAATVQVPAKNGSAEGHGVAAVKTTEYGIVFVDWGKLTPTYSYDTQQALRIYQALQGIPTLFHAVTAGQDGHHVGYLFTDEGKAFVSHLTYNAEIPQPPLTRLFKDEPRGDALTIQRFRELARRKF